MKNFVYRITIVAFIVATTTNLFEGGNASSMAFSTLNCSSSTTLESLVTCVKNQMPQNNSEGFVPPTAAEQNDWRLVVRQMLQGQAVITIPTGLSGIVEVRNFTDSSNSRTYRVLIETLDADSDGFVDRGFGTFIVYGNATRELSHQAPHPVADLGTELQAVSLFKLTDSRSYLMAGSHRGANSVVSSCQSGYEEADVAHNVNNMFHATNAELIAHYGATPWNAIQWHGMAASTCSSTNVYLSHGRKVTPVATDFISRLRTQVLASHPTWAVHVPGTGVCSLNGTDNVQGRLINGVAAGSVCGTAASTYNGRFIHIEQDPGFRTAADWVTPILNVW
jgi:hypothetical protein